MTELNDAIEALKAADAAGNVEDARKLAGIVQQLSSQSKTPERSLGAKIVRGVAAPIKGLQESVLETIAAPADLFWKGAGAIGLPTPKASAAESLKSVFMPGKNLQPETDTEKFLHGAGQGVGDAASFMVPGAAVFKFAKAGSVPQRVGATMATQPVLQATAGAVGGGVGEATDSPWLGVGASLGVPAAAMAGRGVTTLGKKGLQTLFPQASDAVTDATIAKTFQNVDTQAALQRLKQLEAANEPTSFYQLGDESTKRLARATAGAPGAGGDIAAAKLAAQRAGMGERVQGDVSRAFKGDDAFELEPQLLNRLSQNATEAYDRFRTQVPYVWSDDMAEMFSKRPSMKDAIGVAMRNAAEEGKPFGMTRAKDGKLMTAEDFQKGEGIQALTSSAVDDVKKALDGIIEANKNEFTGKLNNYGRLVAQTKDRFLKAVEDADPSGLYKAARKQYGGDAEVVQALRNGREFAKMDYREIRAFMGKASDAEKSAFRSGMQDAIEKSVKQTKGDKTKALFRKDEWTDEQLKAALDPQDYKALKQRIDARKQGWEDRQFVGARNGSQTQLRQADQASLEENTLDVLADVAKNGNFRSAIVSKLVEPLQRRAQGITEQTAPAYANKLFEDNPEKLREMLYAIEAKRLGLATNKRPKGLLSNVLVGQGAGPTAGLLGL